MDERPPGEEPEPAAPSGSDQDRGTELRTFLIADIRGYTAYTAEHGDQAASTLASRFAGLVREVVAGREGFLLELRGDEALAVFVSARQALRAANELQRRFEIEALPRGVGIGLDAGEAISTEGGFRGSALNLAARLCAQAGPGQIVASETVIHLAARVDGLAYVDARTLRLKGFDSPVRAVTVVPEGRAPKRPRRAGPSLPIERRWLLGAGAIALAAAGMAAVAVFVGGRPESPLGSARPTSPATPPPTPVPSLVTGAGDIAIDDLPLMVFIDPATGAITDKVRGFGDPAEAIYANGAFWVLDRRPRAIHRIDAQTHRVTLAVPIAFQPAAFTVGGGRLWVSDAGGVASIHEFDATSGAEIGAFQIDSRRPWYQSIEGLAFADGALLASYGWPGDVARIDPATHRTLSSVTTHAIADLQFADGSAWVLDTWRGLVVRVDMATNKVLSETSVKSGIEGLVASGDTAWVTIPAEGSVTRIDGSGRTTTYATGQGARFLGLDSTSGIVVAGNYGGGTVSIIDVVTGDVRTFTLGHAVQPVAAGGGLVLAGIAKGPEDIVAELPGTVLRAATYETFVQNDPGIGSFGEARRQVDAATCARLLDYPAEGSADGPGLRPVVAAAMPEVSTDGRTYTFQVRPGFAFSPPSNEPLTADTYRYSIERAMSPALGVDEIAPGYQYLSEIRGALALRNGRTQRLEGLRVEGDRLIIDLVRPSTTFLERLWLPLFCPVPIGTPVVSGGINDPPIPRAGKYYIAGHYNDQLTILTRNPNYPQPAEGGFDSIALFNEPNLGRAIGRVERGELDYIAGWGPELAAGGRVDQAWGPGSSAAGGGDQRLFRRPTNSIDFLAVNSSSVALADREVRRAVALALDRTAMTPFGMPTDEILPLAMPGLIERERFPLDGPRTDEARALMGDRRLSLTMAWWHSSGCPDCPVMASDMVRRLAAIGIDLTVTETEDPWFAARGAESGYDLAAGWVWEAYPDPAAFLYDLFERATPDEWMSKADRDAAAAVLELGGTEGDAAAAELAARVADDAELIPLVNGVYGQFVSERVGCLAFQQYQAYLDLTAACLG